MPKLIDYPRTSYTSAWEVAEVVDDTGGKCAIETCARKLNRKVSGSFKAIIGSAVKFGLLTSKRELLNTTTLFRRIKHAYDKQEEILFHREAFLTPPLFTQLCRKFRSRELPVAMLDVLLIREFDVEEINAQSVAKAFIDGARMVNILDENNIMADIDQLTAQRPERRELAAPPPSNNAFRQNPTSATLLPNNTLGIETEAPKTQLTPTNPATITTNNDRKASLPLPAPKAAPTSTSDAIASLFGLPNEQSTTQTDTPPPIAYTPPIAIPNPTITTPRAAQPTSKPNTSLFKLELSGPGINTSIEVLDADDLIVVRALLDKIERQLKRSE